MLLRCLAERSDDGGPLRIPWARPGWFAEAAAWIRERLDDHRLEPGPLVQQRTWSISTVLSAHTASGFVFFKAVGHAFPAEPTVTSALGRRHRESVPSLLALDEERGWMLMHDFAGEGLSDQTDPDTLARALRVYADIQCSWIEGSKELLSFGCPDRTLDVLQAQIDPLLGDHDLLLPHSPRGVPPEQLEAVPALAAKLHADCERLREYPLPATLEHGDLHTDNIRARDGRFVFFDWSDACVSHPFFSLVPFFEFLEEPLAPGPRGRLRDAYLEAWRAVGPRDGLEEAFDLAQFVGLFHQAVSYHRITENTEPRARWEWEKGFPYFVNMLLDYSVATAPGAAS